MFSLTWGKKTPAKVKRRKGLFESELLEHTQKKTAEKIQNVRDAYVMALPMLIDDTGATFAMDAAEYGQIATLDSNECQAMSMRGNNIAGGPTIEQLNYFASQGFIGWQTAAILSQHWLIDKACLMPGKDAVRHGWDITANDGEELDPKIMKAMTKADKKRRIKKQLVEFIHMGRVFGVRIAMFKIKHTDPKFYEYPFNIDSVKPGSYEGIVQIDPYWITPMLDFQSASDPMQPFFYEPTWWLVNGRRVHRTHLIIYRTGELPDILKPAYFYGAVPVPQKILARVFAAEQSANEAPMILATKRLTVMNVDVTQALTEFDDFAAKMQNWMQLMTNFGVKVIGGDEAISQFDTTLAGMDDVIMTQYQLVAAGANVPATKLLGTTPKGFNATGEYDEKSYHEELESIQENDLSPFLDRHYQILIRSDIAPKFKKDFNVDVEWKPVDSPSAKDVAELNKSKADTDAVLANAGAIDGYDIRQRIIQDPASGYAGIENVVPDGPGDREAQQEAEAALEQPVNAKAKAKQEETSTTDEALFNPATGFLGDAQLITHQKFLDDDVVLAKMDGTDFTIHVTPEFMIDGKIYRCILDGHHRLAAALLNKTMPTFIETIPQPEVMNAVTRTAMDAFTKKEEK